MDLRLPGTVSLPGDVSQRRVSPRSVSPRSVSPRNVSPRSVFLTGERVSQDSRSVCLPEAGVSQERVSHRSVSRACFSCLGKLLLSATYGGFKAGSKRSRRVLVLGSFKGSNGSSQKRVRGAVQDVNRPVLPWLVACINDRGEPGQSKPFSKRAEQGIPWVQMPQKSAAKPSKNGGKGPRT